MVTVAVLFVLVGMFWESEYGDRWSPLLFCLGWSEGFGKMNTVTDGHRCCVVWVGRQVLGK
jgi:hypothetical protein